MEELSTCTACPVVIAIDEHNEIYKALLEDNHFFRHFTIASGYLSGVRIFSSLVSLRFAHLLQRRMFGLLSGSAHSKFELSLQSSLRPWLRSIRPLEPDMFEAACFGSDPVRPSLHPLGVCSDLIQIIPLPQALDHKLAAAATGRTPRNIVFLEVYLAQNPGKDIADWTIEYADFLMDEFSKWFNKQTAHDQSRALAFLEWHFLPSTGNNPGIGAFAFFVRYFPVGYSHGLQASCGMPGLSTAQRLIGSSRPVMLPPW